VEDAVVVLREGTSEMMCLKMLLKKDKEGLLQISAEISFHIEGAA